MPNAPFIYGFQGPKAIQAGGFERSTGHILKYDGFKNYIANNSFDTNVTTGWNMGTFNTTGNVPTFALTAGLALTTGQYIFTVTSANATVGATYTNNGQTFTVSATIAAATILVCTATGAPLGSGTLTKASGTGDATITYSAALANVAHGYTIATTSSSPLSGNYSLNYASNGSGGAGDILFSDAFTVDAEDRAQMLSFSFKYKLVTDPSWDFSGTSTTSLPILIYDVTNGAWIQPAGSWSFVQKSGVGLASGTFQTSSNGTQYQLVILQKTSFISSASLYLDSFYVGPKTAQNGAGGTDWASFTPTGSWSANTTYTGRYRRVGDSAEIQVNIALAGAPTSASLTVNLPTGLVIDTTKFVNAASGVAVSDSVARIVAAGTGYIGYVGYNSTTSVLVNSLQGASTNNNYVAVTQAVPGTFAAADIVNLSFTLPIVGWSSSSVMSSDTDTRVVAVNVSASATSVSSSTTIAPTNIVKDTHGAWSGSTFTTPVSGWYRISGTYQAGSNLDTICELYYKINSGTAILLGGNRAPSNTANMYASGSADAFLNAGDAVIFIGNHSPGAAQAPNLFYASIVRQSGPSVIAASESVNARYTGATATVTASFSAMSFTTKDYDSHAAYSGSTYTVPVSGKYVVTAKATITDASGTHQTGLQLYKNSVSVSEVYTPNGPTGTSAAISSDLVLVDQLNCVAGDTIVIRVQDSGTTPTVAASSVRNILTIARVGN